MRKKWKEEKEAIKNLKLEKDYKERKGNKKKEKGRKRDDRDSEEIKNKNECHYSIMRSG